MEGTRRGIYKGELREVEEENVEDEEVILRTLMVKTIFYAFSDNE